MRIININGPINSGKSTVSKILASILPQALFVEVDELLSDEEQTEMNLSIKQGWHERAKRLNVRIAQEKDKGQYLNFIFAYPITKTLYQQWKDWESTDTSFVNITLSPKMEICLQNRGTRNLTDWEKQRIKEMYAEGYQHPDCSDLVIDNSTQTPQETVAEILSFLEENR